LSHAVISGFTTGAAVVCKRTEGIRFGELKELWFVL